MIPSVLPTLTIRANGKSYRVRLSIASIFRLKNVGVDIFAQRPDDPGNEAHQAAALAYFEALTKTGTDEELQPDALAVLKKAVDDAWDKLGDERRAWRRYDEENNPIKRGEIALKILAEGCSTKTERFDWMELADKIEPQDFIAAIPVAFEAVGNLLAALNGPSAAANEAAQS